MRKKPMYAVLILVLLGACAARQTGETVGINRNEEATHRVDVEPFGRGAHGSAVVLNTSGYLLTCHHVAFKPDGTLRSMAINIAVNGGKPKLYPARIVEDDVEDDLTVIKIEYHFRQAVVLGDDADVRMLDAVYNIGFPFDMGETGSFGHVKDPDVRDETRYQLRRALLLEIQNGSGTSGSGIFLVRDGVLVGLMDEYRMYGAIDEARTVVHVAVPVSLIRAFLDRERIPYLTAR